jgi:hypothetical protein
MEFHEERMWEHKAGKIPTGYLNISKSQKNGSMIKNV